MLTIEMLRAMDALLAHETLLLDLAMVVIAIGLWIELSPGPRRSWGFREGAGNEEASNAWSRGVAPGLFLMMLGMFGETSFASNPGRSLILALIFATLLWLRNTMFEARRLAEEKARGSMAGRP